METQEIAEKLFKVKREISLLQAQEKELQETLRRACDGKTARIGRFEYKCSERKGCVDYSKIPQLEGVDLEKYRKKSTSVWTLKVVE